MSTHESYFARIVEVMRDLFDEYEGPITLETTAQDVPQWDSLSHVKLMILIEQELGVRFGTGEIQGFRNIGSLVDAVATRNP
jgi:acyl carrier protein